MQPNASISDSFAASASVLHLAWELLSAGLAAPRAVNP